MTKGWVQFLLGGKEDVRKAVTSLAIGLFESYLEPYVYHGYA